MNFSTLSVIYLNADFTISPWLSFFNVFFCIFKLYPYTAMVIIFFSIFQFKINVYFPKFEINNPIFYYTFKSGLYYLAMVKLFQRNIFACFCYIRILQWLRFFFRFSSLKSMFIFSSFKITTQYSIIFYYIFKCGLHYLAVSKLFQRKIFACLSYIRILQWLRFFFRFSSLNSMFIFPSLKLTNKC